MLSAVSAFRSSTTPALRTLSSRPPSPCASVVDADKLSERMSKLEPVAMRLEVKEGRHGCTLINDSYNSDINSLDIALDFMNRRPDHKGSSPHAHPQRYPAERHELPADLYREVSRLAKERGVEKFIGIGPVISANANAHRHQ
jgi:UDP-N-acetylmuramyl pentapeptide synthase